jgi:O-antigen/teichoic acid export membrane protein
MTLRQQAFSGVRWTTFSSFGRAILQIAQVAILARLLAPTDFGLMALVSSFMAFLQIFADAGISNAIIHHQNISQEQLSCLYWLNVCVSACLALLLGCCAPLIAGWYHQPELTLLLMIAGGVLLISSLSQQLRVIAQKNLQFDLLAKIELLSSCFGFAAAVVSAYRGFGVYSIVIGSLTTATFGTLLVWWLLSGGWRPLLRMRLSEIRHYLTFGAYMIGNNLANTINSQIDVMLGGKIVGSSAIGLYSVPRELNLRVAGMINPIITSVGLPVMAKAQYDKDVLKNVYLQTMRMTASVNFPIYMTMCLFAPEIVHLILGAKWSGSIQLLRIFSLWALVRSTGNPIGSLLLACGRADLSFKWNFILLFIIPPVVWVGSLYGVTGIAIAMLILMLILYWPNWYFQVRPLCGAKFGEYTKQIALPLALVLIALCIGYVITYQLVTDIQRLILGILSGSFLYALLSYSFNKVWVHSLLELAGYKIK